MNRNILDNFTGQDIKKLITSGKITLEELDVSSLYKLMDYETERLCFDDGEMELIEKCFVMLSKKDPASDMDEVFDKAITNGREQVVLTENKAINPKKRFSFKRALVIAAAVSAIVIGGTMVASAFGFNLFEYISEIARQPDRTEKEANGLTFYNGGETKEYASLKAAVEKENLDIMYPASMPDGVVVESVRITDSDIGDKNIQILSNDKKIAFNIDTSVAPTHNAFQGKELYHKDGVDYIIFENETENRYGAYCNVNNCAYTIQAKEHEDLIYIIENMEENQ